MLSCPCRNPHFFSKDSLLLEKMQSPFFLWANSMRPASKFHQMGVWKLTKHLSFQPHCRKPLFDGFPKSARSLWCSLPSFTSDFSGSFTKHCFDLKPRLPIPGRDFPEGLSKFTRGNLYGKKGHPYTPCSKR